MEAAVIVNLGTPEAPEAGAIRRYLRQFLADPRVVDLPRWFWLPLLNLVILNTRPRRLVQKYRLVWGRREGPIRSITAALARRAGQRVRGPVEMAMTYGAPSIAATVERLAAEGARQLTFLPLFPQYAGATTGAIEDQVAAAMRQRPQLRWRLVRDYHDHPLYLDALADSIRRAWAYRRRRPFVVFSFHGIPQAQADAGDPYPEQCQATAAAVAQRLGLAPDAWRLTYQSRFGPAAWLQPYTDETLAALPKAGVRDLLVACPGFAVDCLETLEEIRVLNRDLFLAAGGASFGYVKALNASQAHADMVAALLGSS